MRNHNNLLGQVKGVDGIKTGYTVASGYNLVSSVRRDEKQIVAVVLGGTSSAARDARMRQLIEDHISQASTQRIAPIIAEANGEHGAEQSDGYVRAVAPPTRRPTSKTFDATLVRANAEPVPIPRPRIQAAKRADNTSKQAISSKASPKQAQRLTANTAHKVSRLNGLRDVSASALRRTRNGERSTR
jgi:D-alanyl-D-alanine carboxypeptidase